MVLDLLSISQPPSTCECAEICLCNKEASTPPVYTPILCRAWRYQRNSVIPSLSYVSPLFHPHSHPLVHIHTLFLLLLPPPLDTKFTFTLFQIEMNVTAGSIFGSCWYQNMVKVLSLWYNT